ncbi:GGDEF domain-containing protein [Martelella limonii]|uniref:GGDEF domain-containing protein n=1 Tax=Martelella limonii TaxID=1647649 RepID=UPI0015801828|nr:diguanylate cyclase [Martelella limonii]
MGQLNIVSDLIASLGLGALIVLGYNFILRRIHAVRFRGLASAIVFSCGAIAAMANTIEPQTGYVFDARAIFLTLAAPFGGPIAGVITILCVAAVRIAIGGEGMVSGVIGIAIAGGVGILFSLFGPKKLNFRSLVLLGALCTLHLLSVMATGSERALELFRIIGMPLLAIQFVGTILLGAALESTRRATFYLQDVEFIASRDPLTGLFNRRALAGLEYTIDRDTSSEKKEGCVIMIDIDRFKAVNDRFGHRRGDEVLKKVAATVLSRIRRSDFAVRYGGEEIAVILLSTGCADGRRVAEQIRMSIEKLEFAFEGEVFSVTVSAGVAGYSVGETGLSAALDCADRALYKAKNAGRNRTEVLSVPARAADRSGDQAMSGDAI